MGLTELNGGEHPSLCVNSGELDEIADIFDWGELALREESREAGQLFSELIRLCGLESALAGRLISDKLAGRANRKFIELLAALGINSASDLERRTGADTAACEAVFANPCGATPGDRNEVLAAIERAYGPSLWNDTERQ